MKRKKLKRIMVRAWVIVAVVLLCLAVAWISRKKEGVLLGVEISKEISLCKIEITIAFPLLPLLNGAKEKIIKSLKKERKKNKKRKKKKKMKKKKTKKK